MVNVFVCWPIVRLSPTGGAKISLVIARIEPQLCISASVASDDAPTIICIWIDEDKPVFS